MRCVLSLCTRSYPIAVPLPVHQKRCWSQPVSDTPAQNVLLTGSAGVSLLLTVVFPFEVFSVLRFLRNTCKVFAHLHVCDAPSGGTHTTSITGVSTDFYITVQPVCPDQSNPGAAQKWNICSWRPDVQQETILCSMLGMQCCLFVEDMFTDTTTSGVSCQEFVDGTCLEFYGIGIDGTTQIAALELQDCVGGIPANPQCKLGNLEADGTVSSADSRGACVGCIDHDIVGNGCWCRYCRDVVQLSSRPGDVAICCWTHRAHKVYWCL